MFVLISIRNGRDVNGNREKYHRGNAQLITFFMLT